MATLDEVLAVLNDVLAKMSERFDGGTWGIPADYSVLVRQDQPAGSGTSQFKCEDVPMATNTYLGRLTGDITDRTFAEVRQDLDLEVGTDVQAYDADLAALAGISVAEGFYRKTGAGTAVVHKSNLSASSAPGASDDSSAGYSVGSMWIDTTADKSYICVDATASAAVWNDLTVGGGGGEANTASNLGAGVGVYETKSGVDLRFNSLVGKAGITVSEDDPNDEIDIAVDYDGTTLNVDVAGVLQVNSGGIDTTQLADEGVTVAKMYSTQADVFFGRDSTGAGAGEEINVVAAKTLLGIPNPVNSPSTIVTDNIVTGQNNVRYVKDSGVSINNPVFPGTESLTVPDGTTGERPGTPTNGMVRYNTTTNKFEAYENGSWTDIIGGAHDLLDGSTVQDSVAQTVTRGSLIYGNATPKWDELTLASGSEGDTLRNDGTDAEWSSQGTSIKPFFVHLDTAAKLFSNVFTTTGGLPVVGIGAQASLGGTATLYLLYRVPPVLPGGTPKMRFYGIGDASGSLDFNVSWNCYSSGDLDSLTLTAEGDVNVAFSTTDSFHWNQVALNHTTMTAGALLYAKVDITSGGTSPSNVTTWLIPEIYWE